MRFTSRVNIALRGIGGLFAIVGAISTIRTAQAMATSGTLFSDAERAVETVSRDGRDIEAWAIETINAISLIEATALVSDAIERGDADTLFDLSDALSDPAEQFRERAEQLRPYANDLRARAMALSEMSSLFRALVTLPQGVSTAPNAEAFAMHVSLERLSNRFRAAARPYEAAETQLQVYADWLEGMAYQANREAWNIVIATTAFLLSEMERGSQLTERIRRERRLNEIAHEVAAIDAELNAPVCVPEEQHTVLRLQRSALLAERDQLRSALNVP